MCGLLHKRTSWLFPSFLASLTSSPRRGEMQNALWRLMALAFYSDNIFLKWSFGFWPLLWVVTIYWSTAALLDTFPGVPPGNCKLHGKARLSPEPCKAITIFFFFFINIFFFHQQLEFDEKKLPRAGKVLLSTPACCSGLPSPRRNSHHAKAWRFCFCFLPPWRAWNTKYSCLRVSFSIKWYPLRLKRDTLKQLSLTFYLTWPNYGDYMQADMSVCWERQWGDGAW